MPSFSKNQLCMMSRETLLLGCNQIYGSYTTFTIFVSVFVIEKWIQIQLQIWFAKENSSVFATHADADLDLDLDLDLDGILDISHLYTHMCWCLACLITGTGVIQKSPSFIVENTCNEEWCCILLSKFNLWIRTNK